MANYARSGFIEDRLAGVLLTGLKLQCNELKNTLSLELYLPTF